MARNGSGTMAIPNTFSPGDTVTSSGQNQNFTDIASEITNSLAIDGQSSLTGPLKAANGTAAAPALTFGTDTDTGIYRKAGNTIGLVAGGAEIAVVDSTGVDIKSGTLNLAGSPAFPVQTTRLSDKSVNLQKLFHPSAPSLLLGTNSNAALTITGAANNGSGLIRLTVASTATFATSQKKTVSDVLGTAEANGTWTITVVDGTHIDLQGSTFANAYVSGGTIGGGVDEISLGVGLQLSGSILNATAAAPLPFIGAQPADNLQLQNDVTNATRDVVVTVGRVRDDADIINLHLAGAMIKRLDTAWAAGGLSGAPAGGGATRAQRVRTKPGISI